MKKRYFKDKDKDSSISPSGGAGTGSWNNNDENRLDFWSFEHFSCFRCGKMWHCYSRHGSEMALKKLRHGLCRLGGIGSINIGFRMS